MKEALNRRNLLIRRIMAAVIASLAMASILALVGYSDGASLRDYLVELAIAFSAYLTAALLLHWPTRSDRLALDIIILSLLGSALSFPLKLVFLEGENGIPAYVARSRAEQSWQPFLDLLIHAALFITFTTLLVLPFVALSLWGWHIATSMVARKRVNTASTR